MSRSPEYSPAILSKTLQETSWDYSNFKNSIGEVAFVDKIDKAMLGETVIIGGYLNTELLAAKSVLAQHLNVESLAAISAVLGNVTVGGSGNAGALNVLGADNNKIVTLDNRGVVLATGARMIGGSGVISVLSFVSGGELNGYQRIGYWEFGYGEQAIASITTYIPPSFTITKATIFIKSMPMHRIESETYPIGYYHARNLKLYKSSSSQDGKIVSVSEMAGFYLEFGGSGRTDITQSVLGVSSLSPTGSGIKVYEGDITNHINATGRTVFLVQSTDSANTASPYAGGLQFEVFIEGYKS